MKKKLLLLIPCVIGLNVHAASVNVTSSANYIEAGNRVTFYINMQGVGAWSLQGNGYGATSNCSLGDNGTGDSGTGTNINKTLSVTCTSTSVGQIGFSVTGNVSSVNSDKIDTINVNTSKIVTVTAPREKDTNNYLKSIQVGEYALSPTFNKDTLEYTVSVPSTVNKVKIDATKESSYATVSGTGEVEVNEGVNTFEIKVLSETGSERIYKVIVNVKDDNPINVKINDSEYVVVKNAKNLETPSGYEAKTIKISNFDIPAFYSETTGFTLVPLKDSKGDVSYAIYDETKNTYTLYNENKSDQLILYIKNIPNEKEGFQKTTIKINNETYEALQSEDGSLTLIYAMNIVTGKENYYLYDKEENSYVIYNDKMLLTVKEELLKYKNVILYMAGGLIFLLLLLMIVLLKKSKKKKVIITEPLPPVKEEKDENKVKKNKSKKEEPAEIKKDTTDKKTTKANSQNKDDILSKVNDATSIIENYEKYIKNTQKEMAKKKEEVEETEMYDIFEDDKKKKRKKK